MNTRVLHYFLVVAKEKNISRAAKLLHVSQPTLSKQLKELEEELNVTLFIRGAREIRLTSAGHYLVGKGQEILSLMEKTKKNLMANEVIAGEIYIGGGETKAMRLIASVFKKFSADYPDVDIHLHSGNAEDITAKLDDGLLDFGLLIAPADKQKYEHLRLDEKDCWGLLVPVQHPLAEQAVIRPTDLIDIPLLVSRQRAVANQLSEWLGFNSEKLSIIGTYNLLYNASLMVEQEVGCALCIDGIISPKSNAIRFLPLEPTLTASIHLVWKKEQPLSPAAQKFLAYMKKYL